MKTLNSYIIEKLKIRKNRIKNYLRFEALENSTISFLSETNPNIEYSFDDKEWINWDYNEIDLDKGQTVYMRGDNPNGFSISHSNYNIFIMTGKIKAYGNIMSLLYKDDFEDQLEIPCDYCFYKLFNKCKSLTQAPELPANNLTKWCYYSMFSGCKSLTQAPELPATNLTEWCYSSMFHNCTNLIMTPELPAINLTDGCYKYMFQGCKSLKQKPKIAADINNDNCEDMFRNCPCENK